MTTKPLVSIIMPAFNAEKTIAESIKSVLNQTYDNWELLVVNDGSKDDTSSIVKTIEDDRIVMLEQLNGGVANARNNGIKNAKGKYIAFLDSDDLWIEEKLEKQIDKLLNSNYPMVYSKTLCFDCDPIKTSDCMVHVSLDFENKEKILIYDFIAILTVVVEKRVIDEIGNFDETLRGTEDWDMWIRILQKYDIAYIDDFLAKYRVSSTGLSGNLYQHYIEEEKVLDKHIDLYNKKIYKYRLWFANKKQAIIAKQNKDYVNFCKYFFRLFEMPSLLINFLMSKYLRES